MSSKAELAKSHHAAMQAHSRTAMIPRRTMRKWYWGNTGREVPKGKNLRAFFSTSWANQQLANFIASPHA